MTPSILEQVSAATGQKYLAARDYVIKPGSQADQLLKVLEDSGEGWTYAEMSRKFGWASSALHSAVFRLKKLGLIERDGVVEINNRLHCRWKAKGD